MSTEKANNRSTARARVQLTVELDAGSVWEANATLNQIYEQASRETVNHIKQIFLNAKVNAVVVGKPKVTAVFAVEVAE